MSCIDITPQETEKKIKNYEFPFCDLDKNHESHNCTEICVSRTCISNFQPLCYHCKFEGHKNSEKYKQKNDSNNNKSKIDVYEQFQTINQNKNTQDSVQSNAFKRLTSSEILGQNSKQQQNKNKPKKGEEETKHQVQPIKWVLTSLNQQIQHSLKNYQQQDNTLWDQTEQDLQNMIDYGNRLMEKIKEFQEGAEALKEQYDSLKRQTERDERIKIVQEIMNDLLDDNSHENLTNQLQSLRKYIFVEPSGKITLMGEQEMLKLETEKTEMQDNIDKYTQILQATFDEVQECLMFANDIIRSDQHGMTWLRKNGEPGENQSQNHSYMINASMISAANKFNNTLYSRNQPQNNESIKNLLLRQSTTSLSQIQNDSMDSKINSKYKKASTQNFY